MNFCNHEHPKVKEVAAKLRADSEGGDDTKFVIAAFNWVRDEIKYVILVDWTVPAEFTLDSREGNCGTKACLLNAILRAGGIKKDSIGFGVQRISTGDEFFLVPEWAIKVCSKKSIHFTLIVNLKGKWIHLDTTLDSVLANGMAPYLNRETVTFDGENHAVNGGHVGFDPNHVTIVRSIDEFMQKKSRVPAVFRQCFNLALDYARIYGPNCTSKDDLRLQIEKHLTMNHRVVCQEAYYILMRLPVDTQDAYHSVERLIVPCAHTAANLNEIPVALKEMTASINPASLPNVTSSSRMEPKARALDMANTFQPKSEQPWASRQQCARGA